MRRELKNIAEYKKPSNDAFASVVRSFGEVGARLRFSLSSSAKHMTPTFPRYRSSEGCSSSDTEPSVLAQKDCHMPISTKKKLPTGLGPRSLKPGSIPTPRGDVPLPSV